MNGSSEISLARAVRGPVTLITLGVLFALNNFTPFSFDRTWPVLLIVFGLLSILRRSIEPMVVRGPEVRTAPPYQYPPPPPPPSAASGPGSYRQSSYPGTAAPPSPSAPGATPSPAAPPSPAKGGFGTSAPPGRPTEPGSPEPPAPLPGDAK